MKKIMYASILKFIAVILCIASITCGVLIVIDEGGCVFLGKRFFGIVVSVLLTGSP